MAKNVIINGTTYPAVPYVSIPLSGGGGNAVFYDTSEATAVAANILTGFTAFGPNGSISGQLTVPTISQDSSTKVLTIS